MTRFKPFDQMTEADYAAIGLKGGLEVHQQLLTHRKLFCRCPAGRYSNRYDAEVLRHMRPTLSELGEYDGTALMEKKTRKNIYYRIHQDTVCTYEIDDTPPFFPDDQAVDIALELSMLFNLNIVGEVHIARKQYLDGSIPTGFQRTAILGVGGWIPYRGRRIGMRQLSLEEDSCREVSDEGHDRVLLTDRLGTPLIEAVTEPDMRTPQEIAEVCQLIRLICRGTGRVRRGYGAARQDVNVSVDGGTRVEIKGVPRIPRIPLLVYNEAMRQCALLGIRDELHRRGITPDTFDWSAYDVTRTVARNDYPPIRDALARGHRVKCVVLRGFAGLLNRLTQEHTTFAKEFSDRVRVIACLTRLPNIVHSDTAADLIAVRHWKELGRRTRRTDDDALVLVWGDEADTRTACEEIAIRAREATVGVPADTRQALPDGTTGFERVLPGSERMYPDTDLPPMAIAQERLDRLAARLPVRVWDRLARYREMGLPADVIEPLCISPHGTLFERVTRDLNTDPTFAAVVLVRQGKSLRRRGLDPDRIPEDMAFDVFRAQAQGRLSREGVHLAFTHLAGQDWDDPAHARAPGLNAEPVSRGALEARVARAASQAASTPFASHEAKFRHLMGVLMRDLIGRVEGRRVAQCLTAALDREEQQSEREAIGW